LQALDGVDLTLWRGKALGLVGESGCGKSTLARIAAGFIAPAAGSVTLDGAAVEARSRGNWRRKVQMVFQDPLAALDPRMEAGRQIDEALEQAGIVKAAERAERRHELMSRVGLGAHLADRFPHQLSGGQRQRVVIARALAAGPELLIFDEPLAALDVSVQAQMLELFAELRQSLGLTYLFISHQLATVRHLCNDVAVMYAGRIVEQGPAESVFAAPRHPYTRMLLSTVLDPRRQRPRERGLVRGEPPSPLALPSGCPFHPRCPSATDRCRSERPTLHLNGREKVACHFADQMVTA